MATEKTHTSVVVIGGGQAGLSVSFYLKKLGLVPGEDFLVFDRGPITGGAWQFRWDALHIGSAHRINDLPGMDAIGISFENADRSSPAREVVADYYQQYEEFYGLRIIRPAVVSSVVDNEPLLSVTYTVGGVESTISTEIVINATGTWGAPFIPWYPGRNSFAGRQVHTAEYTDASEFAGNKVVVVGGGTSGIGFLLGLETVAEGLVWVSRRPIDFLEDGELNLEARQSAVALQDEAARAGRALPSVVAGTGVPRTRRIQAGIARGVLTPRPMFDTIEPDGVRWSNGAFHEADAIIWSTGFRPELRHLAPLRLREKEGGVSVANGTSWKDSRVFFAGYGPQSSTIGANRAGRMIARQAIAALSRFGRERQERANDPRVVDAIAFTQPQPQPRPPAPIQPQPLPKTVKKPQPQPQAQPQAQPQKSMAVGTAPAAAPPAAAQAVKPPAATVPAVTPAPATPPVTIPTAEPSGVKPSVNLVSFEELLGLGVLADQRSESGRASKGGVNRNNGRKR